MRIAKCRSTGLIPAFILMSVLCAVVGLAAPGLQYLWTMDTPEEVAAFDNDNTGAQLACTSEHVIQGSSALAVMPDGKALETKVALPLVGERIKLWSEAGSIVINYYFPETMVRVPSMFFMGMADLTTGFNWVAGIFAKPSIKPGWNEVRYTLNSLMRALDETHQYKVYLAFAAEEAGRKIPLTEKFYIDGIYGEGGTLVTRDQLLAQVPEATKQEVASLLKMSDAELLDAVERRAFEYFWHEANQKNGLIKDRLRDDAKASIAAVGFGLTAIPVAIERGWLGRESGYARVLTTLMTFANGGVEGKNGFFYHWPDMNTGRRGGSELSSIDTALFIAGAIFCGEYFKGTQVETLANELYAAIDWQWMTNGGDTLQMEWVPEKGGFTPPRWNSFNEGLLCTLLAMGSPTHPISPKAWHAIVRPIHEDHIRLTVETLFVYQYPQVWFDFRDKEDHYANYFNNAAVATRYNRQFALANKNYKTYAEDVWGLSAGDGPGGYKAYGASPGNHDGTVVPYASIASMPFTPELSMAALRGMLEKHGPLIWGRYGFVSGFNVDHHWYSKDYIGIDQGDLLAMVENYRTGLIWRYFMRNKYVQRALELAGFVAKKSDYAVTPKYAQEVAQRAAAPSKKTAKAARAGQPIRIDGDLADWQGFKPYVVDETMNVPDPGLVAVDTSKHKLRSSFYAAWDREYLYLAADVTDDVVVSNIAPDDVGGYYRTDSVEFYLDPSRGGGGGAGLLKLAVLPFDTQGRVQAVRHEDAKPGPVNAVSPGIKVASRRTGKGYAIEAAIPFSVLGLTPGVGSVLGFCHTVHNTSNTEASLGQFVRENMIAWNNVPEVWSSSQYWGELVLADK
ncbi:MAG: glucoamylase family protein [Bacteroidota bacterium]